MAGIEKDFSGEAWAAEGVKVGYLPQEPALDPKKDVAGNVTEGLGEIKALLDRFEAVSAKLRRDSARRRDEPASSPSRASCRKRSKPPMAGNWSARSKSRWTRCAARPAIPRSPSSRAASAGAWRCAACCCRSPICCCSTSRPTISTPNRWPGCSVSSPNIPAPSSPSPMTAISSTRWRDGFWNWIAARAFPMRAIIPAGSSRSRSASSRKASRKLARQRTLATRAGMGQAKPARAPGQEQGAPHRL